MLINTSLTMKKRRAQKIYTSDDDFLMTTQEVARYLRISEHTLIKDRTRENPRIPYIKIGRKVLYKKSDIVAYVDSSGG